MRRTFRTFAFAILFAGSLAAQVARNETPPNALRSEASYNFLAPGDYHGEEAPSHPGAGWFALHCPQGQCSLAPVTLTAQASHDDVVDEDTTAKSGIYLFSPNLRDPIYYFRGSWAKARPVEQCFRGSLDFDYGMNLLLSIGNVEYRLHAEPDRHPDAKAPEANGGSPLRGFKLLLQRSEDGRAQTLVESDGAITAISVLWAGDLDGDGKLDLILNVSPNENVNRVSLYLSSLADSGSLVGLAGYYETTGC